MLTNFNGMAAKINSYKSKAIVDAEGYLDMKPPKQSSTSPAALQEESRQTLPPINQLGFSHSDHSYY
jgi:hypothetical protein